MYLRFSQTELLHFSRRAYSDFRVLQRFRSVNFLHVKRKSLLKVFLRGYYILTPTPSLITLIMTSFPVLSPNSLNVTGPLAPGKSFINSRPFFTLSVSVPYSRITLAKTLIASYAKSEVTRGSRPYSFL